MEELRSTDVLEKEIQNDARIKAAKILEAAELQCQQVMAGVDLRLENALEERKAYYDHKFELFKNNLDSSLPLEKSRFLVSYISSSISNSINEFLKKLNQPERLSLVLSMLKQFDLDSNKNLSESIFDANVYGFELNSAKKELEKTNLKIKDVSSIDFAKTNEEAIDGIEIHEGIILVSENTGVKIRLTLEQYVSELIDKKRSELATTLFGGRLPE